MRVCLCLYALARAQEEVEALRAQLASLKEAAAAAAEGQARAPHRLPLPSDDSHPENTLALASLHNSALFVASADDERPTRMALSCGQTGPDGGSEGGGGGCRDGLPQVRGKFVSHTLSVLIAYHTASYSARALPPVAAAMMRWCSELLKQHNSEPLDKHLRAKQQLREASSKRFVLTVRYIAHSPSLPLPPCPRRQRLAAAKKREDELAWQARAYPPLPTLYPPLPSYPYSPTHTVPNPHLNSTHPPNPQVKTLSEAAGAAGGGAGAGAGVSVILPDSAASGALGALGYVNTLVRGCTAARRKADGAVAAPKT